MDFRPADLLARPEIAVDLAPFDAAVAGRTALVTGAAGSIGAEISRRLARSSAAKLVLVDRAETELDRLEDELRPATAPGRLVVRLLDVRDRTVVRRNFGVYRPDFVFHAAAFKHVAALESQPAAAVDNNVGGTLVVAAAARAAGVGRFVLISSDKAIRPTSVMGASKQAAEIALRRLATTAGDTATTRFITVRFGNVLDSRGNVVERFRRQLENGGPLTVTHADAVRHFMTAAEAVGLVLRASVLGEDGDVLLLDVGSPTRILDLAERTTALAPADAGPARRPAPVFVGLGPGEKVREEYIEPGVELQPTACPQIMRWPRAGAASPAADAVIRELLDAARAGDDAAVLAALSRAVPGYRPSTDEG